jgi:hypothetical protein
MTVIDLASAEQPRILHVPRYSTSAGDEAVDLAASAGLILDPWQAYVLRNSLGERPDGRWSSFEVGLIVARQQGKGSVLEARELAGLVLFGERQIVHTAHELKTSMKHFKRLVNLFDGSADLRKRLKKVINSNGKEGLEMTDGAVLECLARTKNAGRGFTGDLVVLDEAYALTADQMDATMPTMLAVDNAQVWYTSSPPLDAVSGQVLMSIRDRAQTGEARRLAWFDYGLAGSLDRLKGIDLDDRGNWYAALPSLRSGRIREENVQTMRDVLPTDAGFAREILGIWPPGLGGNFQVIPKADWSDALDDQSEIVGPLALAAAVSLDRTRSSIAACGHRADGKLHVELTSTALRVDNRNGTGWVVPRLVELASRNTPAAIVMDEFGPTGSLIASAEEAGLSITRAGTASVARAYGMFFDAVSGTDPASRVLKHLGQPELSAAVAGAKRRPLGEGFTWDRKAAEVDITPLVAVTNAMWGFAVHGHVEAPAPWAMYA